MTMNVDLPPQLEALVKQKVASGLYYSESEVVGEALKLMEAVDRNRDIKLELLRQYIREGIESGEATPWDIEETIRKGRALLAAERAAQAEK